MRTLVIVLALSLTGCFAEDEPLEGAILFSNADLKRMNIQGVDCIVGAGNFDTTVALSCNWATATNPE